MYVSFYVMIFSFDNNEKKREIFSFEKNKKKRILMFCNDDDDLNDIKNLFKFIIYFYVLLFR